MNSFSFFVIGLLIEVLHLSVRAFASSAQVDPTGSGRVAAGDAALFLKRSGLADLVLGKVGADSFTRGESVFVVLSVLSMLMVPCDLCVFIDLGFGRL